MVSKSDFSPERPLYFIWGILLVVELQEVREQMNQKKIKKTLDFNSFV
jgi:hypothetical protein